MFEHNAHSPFAVEHVFDTGFRDSRVITLEPLVTVQPNERSVVTSFNSSAVVNYRKQRVAAIRRELVRVWTSSIQRVPIITAFQTFVRARVCGRL